jgi:hypothetical protein
MIDLEIEAKNNKKAHFIAMKRIRNSDISREDIRKSDVPYITMDLLEESEQKEKWYHRFLNWLRGNK